MSPTGVSWDHFPIDLPVPKSLFLILVGTQTKPSTKHQSYLQIFRQQNQDTCVCQRRHVFLQAARLPSTWYVCWSMWGWGPAPQGLRGTRWQGSMEVPHIILLSLPCWDHSLLPQHGSVEGPRLFLHTQMSMQVSGNRVGQLFCVHVGAPRWFPQWEEKVLEVHEVVHSKCLLESPDGPKWRILTEIVES